MKKFSRLFLMLVTATLLASCGSRTLQPAGWTVEAPSRLGFIQWNPPHMNLTMLLPDGWVSEYDQGTISIATGSRNFFYSPFEPFEGVLIHMFLSDGPRAVGSSFDVMRIAEQYIADKPNIVQAPTLVERDRRQIITTVHLNKDSMGEQVTYLTGYVLEEQQLTVFLAATPTDTEMLFLPILEKMLYSIAIASPF